MNEEDDGFVTLGNARVVAGGPGTVSFTTQGALIHLADDVAAIGRADWQWDGNGMLRLRVNPTGLYRVVPLAFGRYRVGTGALRKNLPKRLEGQIPITRTDGCDTYIDVSAAIGAA